MWIGNLCNWGFKNWRVNNFRSKNEETKIMKIFNDFSSLYNDDSNQINPNTQKYIYLENMKIFGFYRASWIDSQQVTPVHSLSGT